MKRMLAIAFVIFFALALSFAPIRGKASAHQAPPCHPTPQQLQDCEDAGGIFDYGLCRCRIT
jgi:hypothetical protein